eukprot:1157595-Pelagomonas_calceolata.AAC.4
MGCAGWPQRTSECQPGHPKSSSSLIWRCCHVASAPQKGRAYEEGRREKFPGARSYILEHLATMSCASEGQKIADCAPTGGNPAWTCYSWSAAFMLLESCWSVI